MSNMNGPPPQAQQPVSIPCSPPIVWQPPPESPEAVLTCIACLEPIEAGSKYGLIMVGCGKDADNRRLARSGLPFKPVLAPVHWPCLMGDETGAPPLILVPR